jgi:hypothetical protein
MYLALESGQYLARQIQFGANLPFGWLAFLLHVCKDALGLVVLTVGTCRHLGIAFDLFLATHIASLRID